MSIPRLLAMLAPLVLAGCISYSGTEPAHTTIAVPPGSTVVCTNGGSPPC